MTKILQNQNSNFLKLHKQQALRDIQISIEEWNDFQEKNFFYQMFTIKKKSNHWEASNLMLNLFHVHLKWSKTIIRSQVNIKKKEVLNVLMTMKDFYSKISAIQPDLTHPDVLNCFNLTAKENNLREKKIKLKDKIEINFFDPFNNVLGEDIKNIKKKYYFEQQIALKNIQYTLDFLERIDNKLEKFDLRKFEQPEILNYSKQSSLYEVKFLWCGEELESYKNLKKKDVKKKLNEIKKTINYFNFLRPNLSEALIDKMYKCLMKNNSMNHLCILKIKNIINMMKKKLMKIINM